MVRIVGWAGRRAASQKLPPPISPERGIFFKYCIRVLVCRDKSENGFDVIGGLKSMFDMPSFWAYTLAILNIDLHQGHQPTLDKDQAIQNYILSKKKFTRIAPTGLV